MCFLWSINLVIGATFKNLLFKCQNSTIFKLINVQHLIQRKRKLNSNQMPNQSKTVQAHIMSVPASVAIRGDVVAPSASLGDLEHARGRHRLLLRA